MQDRESTASIKDILAYCFLHWRSALVVVLCGALLGAGYTVLKSRNAASEASSQAEAEAAQSATDSVSVSEAVSEILQRQGEAVEELLGYYQNSPRMSIDPTEEHVASAIVFISDVSDPSALEALVASYQNAAKAGESLGELAQQMGTDPAYLGELVSLMSVDALTTFTSITTTSTYTTPATTAQGTEAVSDHSAALRLDAKGATAEEAAAVRDAVLADLEAAHESFSSSVTPHAFTVVSTTEYVTVDTMLMWEQSDILTRVSSVVTAMANNQNNASRASASVGSSASSQAGISLKSLVKWAVLGGGAAFLLYGFVLCLRYLLAGVPETPAQLGARYGLPLVGSYAAGAQGLVRGRTKFDAWLQRKMGLAGAKDSGTVDGMVAANLGLYAPEAGTVLVAGSAGADCAKGVAERVGSLLEGRELVFAGDILGNADARERLADADAVLLVEEYGKSRFDDIDAELTLLEEIGKPALGFVMA